MDTIWAPCATPKAVTERLFRGRVLTLVEIKFYKKVYINNISPESLIKPLSGVFTTRKT